MRKLSLNEEKQISGGSAVVMVYEGQRVVEVYNYPDGYEEFARIYAEDVNRTWASTGRWASLRIYN